MAKDNPNAEKRGKELQHSALCVTGARQIGKTTLIRHFAEQHYENFVELNFVTDPQVKAVFAGSLRVDAVITALSATFASRLSLAKHLSFWTKSRSVLKPVPQLNSWSKTGVLTTSNPARF